MTRTVKLTGGNTQSNVRNSKGEGKTRERGDLLGSEDTETRYERESSGTGVKVRVVFKGCLIANERQV